MSSSFAAVWERAGVDGKTALMDGGYMEVLDGTQPADVDTAKSGNTTLVTMTFNDPAMNSAAGSGPYTASLNGSPTAMGDANGNATWGRIYTSGDVALFDVTVTGIGGGGEAEISDTSIIIGQVINLVSLALSVSVS